MGGLVEIQIGVVIDVYMIGEVVSVKVIVEIDCKVNEFEKVIDDDCVYVIVKCQLIVFDLCLVFGISKIVIDLEWVGDEVKKIVKGVCWIYENGYILL